jgi:hypothetical protein
MRCTLLQFGSAILAAVALVAIAVSFLSLCSAALAAEPLTVGCIQPAHCNSNNEGELCDAGLCASGASPCSPCCACSYDTVTQEYACYFDEEPDCL